MLLAGAEEAKGTRVRVGWLKNGAIAGGPVGIAVVFVSVIVN